jgi:hypothetical protein
MIVVDRQWADSAFSIMRCFGPSTDCANTALVAEETIIVEERQAVRFLQVALTMGTADLFLMPPRVTLLLFQDALLVLLVPTPAISTEFVSMPRTVRCATHAERIGRVESQCRETRLFSLWADKP